MSDVLLVAAVTVPVGLALIWVVRRTCGAWADAVLW